MAGEDCISLSPLFLLWFCESEATTVPLWARTASFFLPEASAKTAGNLHLRFCASFRIFVVVVVVLWLPAISCGGTQGKAAVPRNPDVGRPLIPKDRSLG